MSCVGVSPSPSIDQESFRAWLHARLTAGETQAQVGRSFGVTQPAVNRWIKGVCAPPLMALLLAEHLMRGPVELLAGLPAEDVEGAGG